MISKILFIAFLALLLMAIALFIAWKLGYVTFYSYTVR
jgi:hypothetical protein